MCASLDRCSSQLPPLLLQSQLPHTEPKQAPIATHPQQPWPHYQGERQRCLINAIMWCFWYFFQHWVSALVSLLLFSVAKTTNNQLFCSVKNMERERRGLFGVEMNATLPADWKHHDSRKKSGLFGFVTLQNLDKVVNSYLQANKYVMVHYNLNQSFSTL